MNLPNLLTFLRIILTIFFMRCLYWDGVTAKSLALFFFLLASFTDYWDGYLARKYHQITALGKFMDPIADKILTLSAFVAFVEMRILAAWMVVIIVTRDLLITGLRMSMPKDTEWQGTSKSGKHKTVLQFISITVILIFLCLKETSSWDPSWTEPVLRGIDKWMIFIVGITLWSGVSYVMKNKKFIYAGFEKN